MSTLETALLVLQLLLAFALICVILFQRTAQDGGGLTGGGGTMGGLFTTRGSANVLTRATSILAAAFMINSLALGYLTSSGHSNRSILDQVKVPEQHKVEPTIPQVPKGLPAVPTAIPSENAAPKPDAAPSMPTPITPDAPVEPTAPAVPAPEGQ